MGGSSSVCNTTEGQKLFCIVEIIQPFIAQRYLEK